MFDNKLTLPVFILAILMTLMTAFQMRQLILEKGAAKEAFASQEQPLEQSKKVADQFQALAVGTAKLAAQGNESAKSIIADLEKAGIKVNPNATPATPAAPAGDAPAAAPATDDAK